MAKGVSGALTRLAKINAASPIRNGAGGGPQSSRGAAASDDDDDAIYLQEDLEDLSARQFTRRRSEPVAERAAPPPVSQPPVQPAVGRTGVAPAASGVAAPRGDGYGPRTAEGGYSVRAEPPEYDDEDEVVPVPGGRGSGRIAERIRRIKTALAARAVRESEPPPPSRGRAAASPPEPVRDKAAARGRAPVLEDAEEPGRTLRGNWRAKQLARVRRRLGMTQAEFARCFGLSTDDVVRWEAGAKPARGERVLLALIMHDPEEMARLVDEALPLK